MLKRNWALIALVYLVLAESLSLAPVPDLSLCLIQPEHGQQTGNHDNKKYCPAFHAGAALVFERVDSFLEHHDKSVVGGFTIVLAISTIGLWLATNKLWAAGERQFGLLAETSAAQSRDMQASIDVARRAYVAQHRTWLKVYPTEIGPINIQDGKIRVSVTIEAMNAGNFPAFNVQLGCTPYRARGTLVGKSGVQRLLAEQLQWTAVPNFPDEAGQVVALIERD